MTGNTKVWRAPLAGLASVAMIATMGVAAATANAATPQYDRTTVTLDANGGQFIPGVNYDGSSKFSDANASGSKYVDSTRKQLTVTDAPTKDEAGFEYTDGVYPGLYDVYGQDSNVKRAGYMFTGWYTSPDAGGQAVDPASKIEDGATLYAHWAVYDTDEEEYTVTFNVKHDGVSGNVLDVSHFDPDGQSDVVNELNAYGEVFVRLADDDQVADWQVPGASLDRADGWVFTGWDKDVASAVRGTTLNAQVKAGTQVVLDKNGASAFYKDGVEFKSTGFDVDREATLDQYQAVKGVDGTPQLAYQWEWTIPGSQKWTAVDHDTPLTVLKDIPVVELRPVTFQRATEYLVNPVSLTAGNKYTKRYFTPATSSFVDAYGQDKLDDLTRQNATFLGWYNEDATEPVSGNKVKTFFKTNLEKNTNAWKDIAPNEVPTYDFASVAGNTTVRLFAGYDADAKYVPVIVHPLYDQAKGFTVKFYTDKTVGEQLKALETSGQLERDGYSVAAYYTKPGATQFATPDPTSEITDKYAQQRFGSNSDQRVTFSDLYVTYSADAKYGTNGLLYNLKRGYYYVAKDPDGKIVKIQDVDKDFDGKWDSTPNGFESKYQLLEPEGYTEASWKSFLATRQSVVTDLLKYFKLPAKTTSIDALYNKVADNLSAEKADEFNQEFFGELKPETSYPDVNYDDYGTHNDEITYLTTKGIVKGYADGTFGYGAPLARVDYIVWLYRAAGSPAADASAAGFSDVTVKTVPNEEFRKAIAWAKAEGVTTGYADGTFAPYATLNRQDAAAFLYRAAGSPKFNESYADVKFGDVKAGDTANHSQAVLWAASNGIAKGYAGGDVTYFGGYSTLVRQDAAAFLARTLKAKLIK